MTLDALLRSCGLPWLEARMLAECALGVDSVYIASNLRTPVSATAIDKLRSLATRRQGGEPIAYILGEREFYGRPFLVAPAVLIPRPETELLCEEVLERLSGPDCPKGASVLDLGTGSGAIALTLACERPDLHVTAVDASAAALRVAAANVARWATGGQASMKARSKTGNKKTGRVRLIESDWFAALAGERFDFIVSNPPYIAEADAHLHQGDLRYEPRMALASGEDGMTAIKHIARNAPAHLRPNGWLLFEHGWTQGEQSRQALSANGFSDVTTIRDLSAHERVSCACWRAPSGLPSGIDNRIGTPIDKL